MADNRLIYQLTDGTPANTDVVPYSGPASGDAFKATVQELWAAGSNPQTNANVGTNNVITVGPSGVPAEAYCMGNFNKLSGCSYAFGDSNQCTGTVEPCSMAYGLSNESYAGGMTFGNQNQAAGTVGTLGPVGANSCYVLGRSNVCSGTNNVVEGYNSSCGLSLNLTRTSGNTYSVAGDYTTYFINGYITLAYNATTNTRISEVLAYSNVQFVGGQTTFELAALSLTPTASPSYIGYWHDCTESFSYGYANQIKKSTSTVVVGRGNTIENGANCHFFGYGFYDNNPRSLCTFVGGDCSLDLSATKYLYMNGMTANTISGYTNSWTVDANGNVNIQSASIRNPLITVNQTSDIDVNAIVNFSNISAPVDGQTFRLVNIGANTITLHKDNTTGTAGKRLIWQKSGSNLAIATNHSVQFIYISTLPLSGSTGGWLVLPDGVG